MPDCKKIGELESRLADVEAEVRRLREKNEEVLNQTKAAQYLYITRKTLVKHTRMGLVNNIPGTTKYRISELDRYRAIRMRKA
jgi:hypothetical protein